MSPGLRRRAGEVLTFSLDERNVLGVRRLPFVVATLLASLCPPPASPALLAGAGGSDVIRGTNAADVIRGSAGADVLYGRQGGDLLVGEDGDDRLFGGRGRDRLQGKAGHDALFGGPGRDRLFGGAGRDLIQGGLGNDRIEGAGDKDRLYGGRGRDGLSGGAGRDLIQGGLGNDRIEGAGDKDRLYGGRGRDGLSGGAGEDVLIGGSGNDRLNGGSGKDRIVCGGGIDIVASASGDRVAADCEAVRVADAKDEDEGGSWSGMDVLLVALLIAVVLAVLVGAAVLTRVLLGRPPRPAPVEERPAPVSGWLPYTLPFPALGILGIAIYSVSVDDASAFASGLLIAAGAFLLGGLFGFLFGIPKSLATDSAPTTNPAQARAFKPNTNLEDISDWLTKIIVGLTLVQFDQLIDQLEKLADFLGPSLGNEKSSPAFASGSWCSSAPAGS